MMKREQLYHIAEHRLVIETTDGKQTEQLLPSFADFLSEEKNEKIRICFVFPDIIAAHCPMHLR